MNAHTEEKFLIYYEDEEHIVRRLGAAVISVWEQLPPSVTAMIIDRSIKVFDNEESEQFEQQLKSFIAVHAAAR